MPNKLWILTCFICVACICYTVYRDVNIARYSYGDLRNRIVGAKLQKDGLVPYMYEWKKEDEKKYFDTGGDYSSEIAAITATPFFHALLYPMVDLGKTKIVLIWMAVQYLMILFVTFVCYRFADTTTQKRLVIVTSTLFLFTEAWIISIAAGQLYLLIPFLLAAFVLCLKQEKIFYTICAGLCAISLILVRPNAMFVILPFLLLLKAHNVQQIIFFLIAPVLFLLFILTSQYQRNLWKGYSAAVSIHVKSHQEKYFLSDPGVSTTKISKPEIEMINERIFYSENGNFFVIAKKLTGSNISAQTLILMTLIVITLLFILFIRVNATGNASLYICSMLGACLYMVADLLSPIHRHQYYTVQWIFPLFLAVAGYQQRYLLIYLLLGFGLFLNIINTPFIRMEHTLGEYIWLVALLIFVFRYKPPTLTPAYDLKN